MASALVARLGPAKRDKPRHPAEAEFLRRIDTPERLIGPVASADYEPFEPFRKLSPQEAATRLGLSRRHVRRLIDAGKLEAEQLPNSHWKIPLGAVLAFEARRSEARAHADRHARELDRLDAPPE